MIISSPRADETDSDHVSIEHISPHPSPGASRSFFGSEDTSRQSFDADLEFKSYNPYDNIENALSTPSPRGGSHSVKSVEVTMKNAPEFCSSPSSKLNGEVYFDVLWLLKMGFLFWLYR